MYNNGQESIWKRITKVSYIERGVKSPSLNTLISISNTLNVSVDILLGKELKKYSSEKLKHIEKRLTPLPEQEQQRILDIMDSAITIELDYYSKRG